MKSVRSHLSFAAGRLKISTVRLVIILAVLTLMVSTGTVIVRAVSCSSVSDCDSQIANISGQNANAQSSLDQLQSQAQSYQGAVDDLQQQISSLQGTINDNEAKQAALQQQINDYKAKIDAQKKLLASDIRAMYIKGDMSSLEMLASSNNLSDYVDQQEYRNVIQNKIQDSLTQIGQLEAKVKDQKSRVDDLLKDLGAQQSELSAAQAKQNELLSYNQEQQANYSATISNNNSSLSQLRAERQQQIIDNERLSGDGGRVVSGDPSHGGYPAKWDYPVRQDSVFDSWGMYNRECVSYTAWKVYQAYGYMPYWGGMGNANQWPGDARRYNIPTGSTPKVNSVAIWNVGYYGHAMWVEAVNSDGSIWVSQYNYDLNGHYSEMLVSPSMAANLTYIYFN